MSITDRDPGPQKVVEFLQGKQMLHQQKKLFFCDMANQERSDIQDNFRRIKKKIKN